MAMSSDGGGVEPKPAVAGTKQHMQVEPESIDAALKLFHEANEKVKGEIQKIYNAYALPWANDPVSAETADKFNDRTIGGDASSAMAALKGYQKQLADAVHALESAKKTYQNNEDAAHHSFAH